MRINAIVGAAKYNEQRKFNDTSQYNTKQNSNNGKVSFSDMLSQAMGSLYLQNNVRKVGKSAKKR
ncbi:hypothetical protein [Clostridium sp. 'White wine YQ']|uniref:hypothetical protein n=1 Tax=Clostridium sp. 'White wine YQ' TaxID=3027474 RepID=UPI00236669A8|nr:hypothetical protein [Clostridium sp. 'White wine YQ']MDD7795519.1 hypothetical protein [Clostridium sp. 'White wine YQ']